MFPFLLYFSFNFNRENLTCVTFSYRYLQFNFDRENLICVIFSYAELSVILYKICPSIINNFCYGHFLIMENTEKDEREMKTDLIERKFRVNLQLCK